MNFAPGSGNAPGSGSPPEIDGAPAATTVSPSPRRRVFLEQTAGERIACTMWMLVRVMLFRWSPFNWWRVLLLRVFGARCGRGVHVSATAKIHFPWNLRLGDDVHIAHMVIINCMGEVGIGDRTRISQYVHLVAGSHAHEQRDMRIIRCPITIGKDCWIAADAFVGPDVRIGDGSMLAARSSAFEDLPGGFLYKGEPARPGGPWPTVAVGSGER